MTENKNGKYDRYEHKTNMRVEEGGGGVNQCVVHEERIKSCIYSRECRRCAVLVPMETGTCRFCRPSLVRPCVQAEVMRARRTRSGFQSTRSSSSRQPHVFKSTSVW